jgi:hypothetical protein
MKNVVVTEHFFVKTAHANKGKRAQTTDIQTTGKI